jgi:hypothetical protein
MNNVFLLSWDCEGLEAVVNVTEYEKATAWALLEGKQVTPELNSIVQRLLLRARANPQRHYEIYTMSAVNGISEKDIREMFDNDPQGSAELIRDRGNQIFSDRVEKSRVKIV